MDDESDGAKLLELAIFWGAIIALAGVGFAVFGGDSEPSGDACNPYGTRAEARACDPEPEPRERPY